MHLCRRTSKFGVSDDYEETGVDDKVENGGRENYLLLHLLEKAESYRLSNKRKRI